MGNARSDKGERNAAKAIAFIPLVGTVYEAGAAVAYAGKGNTKQANKCGVNFAIGAAVDAASVASGGGARAAVDGVKLAAGGAKVYRAGGVVRNVGGVFQVGSKEGGKRMMKDGLKQVGRVVASDSVIRASIAQAKK